MRTRLAQPVKWLRVDTKTTDPTRPSTDPADMTGDDEHHPDTPTEPPDKPEGKGGPGGEQRVKEVVSEVSREHGDDERRLGRPDEPHDDPQVEPPHPTDVQVEPGDRC